MHNGNVNMRNNCTLQIQLFPSHFKRALNVGVVGFWGYVEHIAQRLPHHVQIFSCVCSLNESIRMLLLTNHNTNSTSANSNNNNNSNWSSSNQSVICLKHSNAHVHSLSFLLHAKRENWEVISLHSYSGTWLRDRTLAHDTNCTKIFRKRNVFQTVLRKFMDEMLNELFQKEHLKRAQPPIHKYLTISKHCIQLYTVYTRTAHNKREQYKHRYIVTMSNFVLFKNFHFTSQLYDVSGIEEYISACL